MTEKLEGRSLEFEDYFAPYRPIDAKLFDVWVENKERDKVMRAI